MPIYHYVFKLNNKIYVFTLFLLYLLLSLIGVDCDCFEEPSLLLLIYFFKGFYHFVHMF